MNAKTATKAWQTSYRLALVVRHRAKKLELEMDDRGYVKVEEVLKTANEGDRRE